MEHKKAAHHLTMTRKEFTIFRDFVYSRTHIFCADTQKALFERKVRNRLLALHLPSFQEYYELLTSSVQGEYELHQFLDTIAVHETSFFRIQGHFSGLRDVIFPALFQQMHHHSSPSTIRVWSAGCSTGEEPYSIVIAFLELLASLPCPLSPPKKLKVVATDMSPAAVEKAREGVYSPRQVQKLTQPLLDKYFSFQNNWYYIDQQVKDYITFKVFNLINLAHVPQYQYDMIFCRNVLIYFDRQAQAALLGRLIHLLPEGGYLFLGDAESIHLFPESAKHLEFIETGNAIIYQKRGEASS